jgi:hypothetical protein
VTDDVVDEPAGAEIVELPTGYTGAPDDVPVRRHRPELAHCLHRLTRLDVDAHRVYCRDCDAEVDPFGVLVQLAGAVERWENARDRAHADAKHAAAELAEIKRQLRNAKAQLRRATS